MDILEVKRFILTQATNDDLYMISDAIKDRRSVLKEITTSMMEVGTRVALRGLSPKYLNGRTGEVVKTNRKTVDVRLDLPINTQRFFGTRNVTVPATCIEEVE